MEVVYSSIFIFANYCHNSGLLISIPHYYTENPRNCFPILLRQQPDDGHSICRDGAPAEQAQRMLKTKKQDYFLIHAHGYGSRGGKQSWAKQFRRQKY
jgi:hypothetical protein